MTRKAKSRVAPADAAILSASSFGRLTLVLCAALALATIAAYAGVGRLGFVKFDDEPYVTANPHVLAGLSGESVRWALTGTTAAIWHPVTMLSLMLDRELSGDQPRGHHRTNLAFHVANALFLLALLSRLTGAPWRAAFVAALFALHPLHVESVAWISARKDVLSGFFWLLALLAYGRYAKSSNATNYLAVLVLFILGMMSKPVVVTLPITLLLLDYWPLKRWETDSGNPPAKLIAEKIPFFVLSAVLGAVAFWAQREAGAVAELDELSMGVRISNAVVSYSGYMVKTAWPVNLGILYPHPGASLPAWKALGAAAFLAGATYFAFFQRQRRPWLVFGWLWYVVTLLPTIGIVQVGAQAMADRYTYFPLIGLFVVIAWSLPEPGEQHGGQAPWLLGALGIGSLLALGAQTRRQVAVWRDDETVWRHAIAVTGPNAVAHFNLATELAERKRHDEALGHYSKAAGIDPQNADAYSGIGNIHLERGDDRQAEVWFRKALQVAPRSLEGNANMGVLMTRRGNYEEAYAYYENALRLGERQADVRRLYGMTLCEAGRASARKRDFAGALALFLRAIQIDPASSRAHAHAAKVYETQGHRAKALVHYREAERLTPAGEDTSR